MMPVKIIFAKVCISSIPHTSPRRTRLFERTSNDVNIRQPENIGFPADDIDTGADNEQQGSVANTTNVAPDVTAPAT